MKKIFFSVFFQLKKRHKHISLVWHICVMRRGFKKYFNCGWVGLECNVTCQCRVGYTVRCRTPQKYLSVSKITKMKSSHITKFEVRYHHICGQEFCSRLYRHVWRFHLNNSPGNICIHFTSSFVVYLLLCSRHPYFTFVSFEHDLTNNEDKSYFMYVYCIVLG